jgi:hypothetical protein
MINGTSISLSRHISIFNLKAWPDISVVMHSVLESVLEVRAEIHWNPRYGVILQPWQTHIMHPRQSKAIVCISPTHRTALVLPDNVLGKLVSPYICTE